MFFFVVRHSDVVIDIEIGNENTKAVETPITPPPIRNVIVIDVHVTIPIEELQVAPQVETKKQGERRMSRRQSNLPPNLNANPNATKTQSKPKFLVETHQVSNFILI